MIHLHPDAWFAGRLDPTDERNRMHLVALREARTATEYRESVAAAARTAVPVRRLAVTAAGPGSNADLAACCA